MVAVGFGIGAVFDFFSVLGKQLHIPTAITDGIFWLTATVISSVAFISFFESVIRGYEIIGAVSGAVLYFLTISGTLRACFMYIFKIFLNIFKFIFKILLTPSVFFYKMVYVKALIHFNHGRKHEK